MIAKVAASAAQLLVAALAQLVTLQTWGLYLCHDLLTQAAGHAGKVGFARNVGGGGLRFRSFRACKVRRAMENSAVQWVDGTPAARNWCCQHHRRGWLLPPCIVHRARRPRFPTCRA